MILHKITEFYTKRFSVCPNITSKFRTTTVFKSSAKENNGYNKICRYIHDGTKLHLSKSNGSWVVSTKPNFKFQQPVMFVFLVFRKSDLVVHPLKIYQHTKFYGPALTGENFASTSMFECPPFWNSWSYGIKDYGVEVSFNGITLLNFIKSTNWFKSL
jgi:hypothetical protein